MIERDITYDIPVRLYFLYVAFINSRVNRGWEERGSISRSRTKRPLTDTFSERDREKRDSHWC